MSSSNYHKVYQKNEVATSNQGKLVLMMYDGAIKFTSKALQCLQEGDVAGKGTYIRKTQDIINELSLALNMEKGGEISKHLESLYRFMIQQLTLSNIKGEEAPLHSVLKILKPLREAWNQVFDPQTNPASLPSEPAPSMPTTTPPPGHKSITARC